MSSFLVKGATDWPIKVADVERACGVEGQDHGILINTAIITHCINGGMRGRETWNVERQQGETYAAFNCRMQKRGEPESIGEGFYGNFLGSRADRLYHTVTFAPTTDKWLIADITGEICAWVLNSLNSRPDFTGTAIGGDEREAFYTHANRGTGSRARA